MNLSFAPFFEIPFLPTHLLPSNWLQLLYNELNLLIWELKQVHWYSLFILLVIAWVIGHLTSRALFHIFRLPTRLANLQVQEKTIHFFLKSVKILVFLIVFWLGLIAILPPFSESRIQYFLYIFTTLASTSVIISLWGIFVDFLPHHVKKFETGLGTLLIPYLKKTGLVVFLVLGVLIALIPLGWAAKALMGFVGIGFLVLLSLSFQKIFENFFASMNILYESPFAVGDWIKMGDIEGVVENVTMWHTQINTSTGSTMNILNRRIPELDIENFGALGFRFVHFNFFISKKTDPKTAKDFIESIRILLLNHPLSKNDGQMAYLYDISSYGIEILIQVYLKISSEEEEYKEREKLILEILSLAQKHSVQISSGLWNNRAK